MSVIDESSRANRLARAISADILIYNEDKFKEGCKAQNPFQLIGEELIEGYLLYKSRVTPELSSNFASCALSLFGAKALEYNIQPDSLIQHLAHALAEHATEAGALQNVVHVITQEPKVEKKPSILAPPLAPKPPTPVVDNATRIKVKQGSLLEDSFLLLFPSGFAVENSYGNRETYLLANIQDIKIDRSFGGEIQLRVEVSYREELFTLTSVEDLTQIVMHLLPAFGKQNPS